MTIFARLRRDEEGASLVEFALVIPLFVMMIVGGFYAAFAAFTASNLHFAVEAGARCASITKTVCGTNTATAAYAQSRFMSIGPSPTFVASSAACGQRVTGTVTFPLSTGLASYNVPLSAQACYP